MSQIILFDLPSKDRCAWSLNPWKSKSRDFLSNMKYQAYQFLARLALNFKGIDYKTEWLEYPDIAAKFKSLSVCYLSHHKILR